MTCLAWAYVRRWFSRQPARPAPPVRTEECQCGRVMPVTVAHMIGEAWADDTEPGAGSGVSAAYCPECCPADGETVQCNHPEEQA